MSSRFKRDFKLIVTVDGQAIEIVPPLRIAFEATKSVFGQANRCTIKIYNLGSEKRNKLSFEPEDRRYARIVLSIGYESSSSLLGIFRGNVWRGKSEKTGTDFITTLESIDGGQDYFNAFTSKTVKGQNVISTLNGDMPNTALGSYIPEKKLVRPKVLVGSSSKLIEQTLDADQSMFIDDERMYIIDDRSYVDGKVPEVSADTGLMATPKREKGKISFITLINPLIRVGRRCSLVSSVAPVLNGTYRVDTAIYKGDTYGSDWSQECEARFSAGMRSL